MDATALMAKERMVPKVVENMSQHQFRSRRREKARHTRDAKLLDIQLELAHAYYEKGHLHQRLLEAMAEVSWWREWWNTGKQNLCNVEVVLDALNQPAPGVQADECKFEADTKKLKGEIELEGLGLNRLKGEFKTDASADECEFKGKV